MNMLAKINIPGLQTGVQFALALVDPVTSQG